MKKVVAVIGASSDRNKFGNRAVRAFQAQGYTVVPINPHEADVEGLKTYPTVLDYPGTIDMASAPPPAPPPRYNPTTAAWKAIPPRA